MATTSREDVVKVGQGVEAGKDDEPLWPVFDNKARRDVMLNPKP